jgi:hypothetical protein
MRVGLSALQSARAQPEQPLNSLNCDARNATSGEHARLVLHRQLLVTLREQFLPRHHARIPTGDKHSLRLRRILKRVAGPDYDIRRFADCQ